MKRYLSKSGVIFTYKNNATRLSRRSNRAAEPHFYCKSLQFSETVRLDERLSNNERILLADIIDLVKQKGYCYATNEYLAKIHHVSPRTITRWLKKLRELLYITIEIIKTDKKEIIERRIRIIDEISQKSITENQIQITKDGTSCSRSFQMLPYRQNCRKNINLHHTAEKYAINDAQTTGNNDTKKPSVTASVDLDWLNGWGYDPLE